MGRRNLKNSDDKKFYGSWIPLLLLRVMWCGKWAQFGYKELFGIFCFNRWIIHFQTAYDKYDGFVILHGTDTLAYTASALSFILENLAKPVVITGSQVIISASSIAAIVEAFLVMAEFDTFILKQGTNEDRQSEGEGGWRSMNCNRWWDAFQCIWLNRTVWDWPLCSIPSSRSLYVIICTEMQSISHIGFLHHLDDRSCKLK